MKIKPSRLSIKRKEHKGQNGKVLIVGGSENYVGAPALAGLSAYQTGVDQVVICAPEKVAWTINSFSPDLVTRKFLGKEFDATHVKEIIKMSENFDCILIGNGLGKKKEFVNKLVRNTELPKIVDADALRVLNPSLVENCLFTPHTDEFQDMFNICFEGKKALDEEIMDECIKSFQKAMGKNVVLLKGKEDLIFSKHRRTVNKTGHNCMTVSGTGDVLAGLCAGYVAMTKNLFESAKEAAFVMGKSGESLFKQKGYSIVASDFIGELWKQIK